MGQQTRWRKARGRRWHVLAGEGQREILALGVYPAVALLQARKRRDAARALLAKDVDPSTAKQHDKAARRLEAVNTFEAVAREFHQVKADGWSAAHTNKWFRG